MHLIRTINVIYYYKLKAVVISKLPKKRKVPDDRIFFIHNVSQSKPLEIKYLPGDQTDDLLESILSRMSAGEVHIGSNLSDVESIIKMGYVQGLRHNGIIQDKISGRSLLIFVKGGLLRFLPIRYSRFDEGRVFYRSFMEVIVVYDSPKSVLKKALLVAMSKFEEF